MFTFVGMIPITQTKVVVRGSDGEIIVNGNCYPAVIASMLELPITEVPNIEVFFKFSKKEVFWDVVMNKWLELMGWKIVPAPEYKIFHPEVPQEELKHYHFNDDILKELATHLYLITGPSQRGVHHICIFKAGKLVHDPHPTREGLIKCQYFERLVKI